MTVIGDFFEIGTMRISDQIYPDAVFSNSRVSNKQSWGLGGGGVSFLKPKREQFFVSQFIVSSIFEDLFGGHPDYRIRVSQKKVKFFPQKIHAFLCLFLQNQNE